MALTGYDDGRNFPVIGDRLDGSVGEIDPLDLDERSWRGFVLEMLGSILPVRKRPGLGIHRFRQQRPPIERPQTQAREIDPVTRMPVVKDPQT